MRSTKIDCKNCDSEYDGATDADCEIVTFCGLHRTAPDLLAACEKMIEITGGSDMWNGETHNALKMIEAAVKKAKAV